MNKADKIEVAAKASQSDLHATYAAKADITYVNSRIASVANGSPKGVYASLVAMTAAYTSGNSNIYLVTADGKWYYWLIQRGQQE